MRIAHYGYIGLGLFHKAIEDCNKATRMSNVIESWRAYPFCVRGYAYDALGRHQEAVDDYKKANSLYREGVDFLKKVPGPHSNDNVAKECDVYPNIGKEFYLRAAQYEQLGKRDLASKFKQLAKNLGYTSAPISSERSSLNIFPGLQRKIEFPISR